MAALGALGALPLDERLIARETARIHGTNILQVKNSKAGCTTLSQIMYFSRAGKFSDQRIHRRNPVLDQGPRFAVSNLALAKSADRFLFTSTRHPETRAVSGFRDVVRDAGNPVSGLHRRALIGFGYDPSGPEARNFDVFLDYVEASMRQSRWLTDRHWREQVVNTSWARLRYDLVIRLESFSEQLPDLLARLEMPRSAWDAVLSSRFNRSSPAKADITAAQKRRIRQIYAADFDAFSYD